MTGPAPLQISEGRENRRAARKHVLLSGKIASADGAFSFNCTIRDISETGARVAISRGQGLSNSLYLIDLQRRVAHDARVVWQRSPLFGLTFVATYPLSQPLEPNLEFLRRLWFDCASR